MNDKLDELKEIRRENLGFFCDEKNKRAALAASMDCHPSYITNLINGIKPITEKGARKLEKAMHRPFGWLDVYHTEEDMAVCPAGSSRLGLNNVEPFDDKFTPVPVISWVQAGAWCEAIDNFAVGDAEQWLPCPVAHSKHTYALYVKGDSMTSYTPGKESYPEGTLIYIDPEAPLSSGKKVIAKLLDTNEVTFKVYREDAGKKWLIPLNQDYDKIEFVAGMHICGVAIFSGNTM